MPARLPARTDARMRRTMRSDRQAKAAAALRRARARASKLNKRLKESEREDQIKQLGWTITGGAAGGAALGMLGDEGIMGFDPRLVIGVVSATGCLMFKSKGIQTPLCGLASGMLASFVNDSVAGLIGGDEIDETVTLSEAV